MPPNVRNMAPELQFRLRQIAQQQRRSRWIRGWLRFGVYTIVITAGATALLLGGEWMSLPRLFIAGAYLLAETILLWTIVIRPARQPVTMRDIAIFVDEHNPELRNRMVSAVEFSSQEYREASPWMIEQFLKETRLTVKPTIFVDLIDTKQSAKMALSLALAFLIPAVIILTFHRAWLPTFSLQAIDKTAPRPTFDFDVEPGNVRVRMGESQVVWVKSNKGHTNFSIRWRSSDRPWEAVPMQRGATEDVYFKEFFNIQEDIIYEVRTGRIASEIYRLTAWLPPEVNSIDITYTYPEYAGLAQREVPNSGNITALEGSEAGLNIWVNKKLKSAELILESGPRIPLNQNSDALWTGALAVTSNDKYHIELIDLEDAPSEFNPQYHITAQRDEPPSIHIAFPRDDAEVSALEEIPFDFDVSDDFGIDEFGLQYQIVGQEPVRVALSTGEFPSLKATGAHRILLEDFGLEVGDLITWTVWAKDRKPDRTEYEQFGDPYFLEIRPFKRKYSEAVSNQSGAGGRGGGESDALSEKDILIATWKLRKDAAHIAEEEFIERKGIIVESQKELLDKFIGASTQDLENAEKITGITLAMAESVKQLKKAELPYPGSALSEAIAHEQKAHRLILKLQPPDSQVRQNRGRGGGGGGGENNRPDINELEMDRNRNFFEEESLTQQQEEAVQEALNKIKKLARRQKMINDEIAKLVSEKEKAQTEDEKDEIDRQLKRLQQEERRNLTNLDDLEREMANNRMDGQSAQEAREALADVRENMNRSLENLEKDELQRARAAGTRALAGLDKIEEKLQDLSGAAVAQRIKSLQKEMERLVESEGNIVEAAQELREQHETPGLQNLSEAEKEREKLLEEKRSLKEDFTDMMERAGDLAERAAETQELTARKLGDWLRETSREGILEEMDEGEPLVKHGFWESAVRQEQLTHDKMKRAAAGLERVAQSLVEDELEGMQKALEELRNLTDEESGQGLRIADAAETQQNDSAGSQEPSSNGAEEQQGAQASADPQGNSDSQGNSPNPSSSNPQTGRRGGANQSGGYSWGGPSSPQELEQFFDYGYQRWLEAFRDAEALLPESSEYRSDIGRIRTNLEELRRRYRRTHLVPRFDLFLEKIAEPFTKATNELDEEIKRLLKNSEFVLADDGEVPPRYRKRASDYFRALSESEGSE